MIAGYVGASPPIAQPRLTFRGFVPRKGCRTESRIAPSTPRNLNELCAGFVHSEKKDIGLGHPRTRSPPKRVVIIIAIKCGPHSKTRSAPSGDQDACRQYSF